MDPLGRGVRDVAEASGMRLGARAMGRTASSRWQALLSQGIHDEECLTAVCREIRARYETYPGVLSALRSVEGAPLGAEDRAYEKALQIIEEAGRQLERSAWMVRCNEEQRRDVLLAALNSHFEGNATGETFNLTGRTDILVRMHGRNVFIGECKIWRGPRKFAKAVDQLLGYLAWSDRKAAIILFIETYDVMRVTAGACTVLEAHPCYLERLTVPSNSRRHSFVFRRNRDSESGAIDLTLLPVVQHSRSRSAASKPTSDPTPT